jgi:LacI family transcriptional regulator
LPKPIGVLSCNDDWGLQLLDACRRAAVAVPDEVAVISVENDPIVCNLATPTLTSIDVDAPRVGFEAASLLDRMMRGQRAPKEGVFLDTCRVEPRRSTDILALDDVELVKAARLLRDQACSGIDVEAILAEVPLSRSSLERRFKAAFGRTPKAEILAIRIDKAKQLLAETDWPLKQIAERCGFHSEKYFGDAFFAKVGQRPGRYRRQVAMVRPG